jgi:transcriptional regulator with XRE-family HTH domain
MNIKEKLQFFIDNGMSISYVAEKMGVNYSTLSKWLKGQKNISRKNEELVFITLQNIVDFFQQKLEE